MCGRFAFTASKRQILKHFALPSAPEIPARYNIVPGRDIAVVRLLPEKPSDLVMPRWGLIPSWAKDMKIGYKMINARAESITAKPAFRNAFRQRRCLIPATGFYEWEKKDSRKQPWFIRLKDEVIMAFAGLWEYWVGARW